MLFSSGNPGVTGEAQQNPYSIGYVELIYALQNGLEYGMVHNSFGNWVRSVVGVSDRGRGISSRPATRRSPLQHQGEPSGATLARGVVDGRLVGIIGPTDTGNTTLFRVLLGQVRLSAGSARVLGGSPRRAYLASSAGSSSRVSFRGLATA